MDEHLQMLVQMAAVPGLLLGLWAGIRSGFVWTLLGAVVGAIGGLLGGLGIPALLGAAGIATQDGPLSLALSGLAGALILLLLTSGLRRGA